MARSTFGPNGVLFRRQLKERRIQANLKQQEVADRLKRPQSFVAKYERGERRLDVIEFIEIAEAIGFDPAEFISQFTSCLQQPSTEQAPAGRRTPRGRP